MKKKAKTAKLLPSAGISIPLAVQSWTFLTNHTHVLLCLFSEPEMRIREVAVQVGITERMVQKIVHELEETGYLTIEKRGRCNSYRIHDQLFLRHPLEAHHSIGAVLKVLAAQR